MGWRATSDALMHFRFVGRNTNDCCTEYTGSVMVYLASVIGGHVSVEKAEQHHVQVIVVTLPAIQ